MIKRNFEDREVQQRLYKAHTGADAAMLLDSRELQGMLFFAQSVIPPGQAIEVHADPFEEIYYILSGSGIMQVGADRERVGPGDAVWIPAGAPHGLENDGPGKLAHLVAAARPHAAPA
jgi:mannose-6-phosphate isomerase-like protein (cupin superfamily)